MRVQLKGLNKATCKLASGERVTYYYAWRGGPKLPGVPGSPEFMTAYNEAVASKVRPQSGVLFSVLAGYQASGDFKSLAPRRRTDYIRHIREIEREFGDLPLDALKSDRVRAEFLEWARSPRRSFRAAGGLCADSARSCVLMGSRAKARRCEPM